MAVDKSPKRDFRSPPFTFSSAASAYPRIPLQYLSLSTGSCLALIAPLTALSCWSSWSNLNIEPSPNSNTIPSMAPPYTESVDRNLDFRLLMASSVDPPNSDILPRNRTAGTSIPRALAYSSRWDISNDSGLEYTRPPLTV